MTSLDLDVSPWLDLARGAGREQVRQAVAVADPSIREFAILLSAAAGEEICPCIQVVLKDVQFKFRVIMNLLIQFRGLITTRSREWQSNHHRSLTTAFLHLFERIGVIG